MPDIADDEEKPTVGDKEENEAVENGEAQDGEKKEEAEEENQIDSRAIEVEEVEPMEDVEEEVHGEYEASNNGDQANAEPYDPNDIWVLDVNNKNKVKSIKKLILEKIKLNKKANILVYKKNEALVN